MIVVDASVVVAALLDRGDQGVWARQRLHADIVAPAGMPTEVMAVLRRTEQAGRISSDIAALAVVDLLDLPVTLLPFGPFGARIWALRSTVTIWDAWYVAIAEELAVPLVTLDLRLTKASGPSCAFEIPAHGGPRRD